MYARIHKSRGAPPEGALEARTYRRLAADEELTVSLFDTQDEAAADPTAEWYEVEADHPGAGSPGGSAAFLYFDGPISDEVHRAAERAHRERIAPVMRTQPGVSRALVLWQLARLPGIFSVGHLPSDGAVLGATVVESRHGPLRWRPVAGEDPALLLGPNRVELFRAVSA